MAGGGMFANLVSSSGRDKRPTAISGSSWQVFAQAHVAGARGYNTAGALGPLSLLTCGCGLDRRSR